MNREKYLWTPPEHFPSLIVVSALTITFSAPKKITITTFPLSWLLAEVRDGEGKMGRERGNINVVFLG